MGLVSAEFLFSDKKAIGLLSSFEKNSLTKIIRKLADTNNIDARIRRKFNNLIL